MSEKPDKNVTSSKLEDSSEIPWENDTGLAQSQEELVAKLRDLNKSLAVDDLKGILGTTVKHDDENKTITFLSMLLTFTEEDQINIGFLAESSTGKSYIPLELSKYFPELDVIKLGYASPTAFFHEHGVALPDPNDKRDVEEEKKRKIIHVDLHQKILIFLDQPHDQLLQRLRSLLSHDEKDIILKITDKREKFGLKTKTVVIEGYPTVIFCTAKFSMADQEKTRLLLLSPEIGQEKLRETIVLKIERESDREDFRKRMIENPERKFLAARVEAVKTAGIRHVKIPEEFREKIYSQFLEDHRFLISRHQRDISRLLAIIKGHALLNYMCRQRIGDSIVVASEDVEAGFRLYYGVAEANELGLSPELFNVYQKLRPFIPEKGISLIGFQSAYFQVFHKPLGYDSARKILKTLTSVGLLTEKPDPNDRRVPNYFVFESGVTQDVLPPSEKHNSFQQTYETLRNNFKEPFYEQKALDLIVQLRKCDLMEAEKLFQVFVDEGKLFRDPYGLWVWNS